MVGTPPSSPKTDEERQAARATDALARAAEAEKLADAAVKEPLVAYHEARTGGSVSRVVQQRFW